MDFSPECSFQRYCNSLSWNFLEATVGVASLNAASQYVTERRNYRLSNVDVVDLIEKGDRVVMIGDFKPILPKIRRKMTT